LGKASPGTGAQWRRKTGHWSDRRRHTVDNGSKTNVQTEAYEETRFPLILPSVAVSPIPRRAIPDHYPNAIKIPSEAAKANGVIAVAAICIKKSAATLRFAGPGKTEGALAPRSSRE
jgi:hypothetical protein